MIPGTGLHGLGRQGAIGDLRPLCTLGTLHTRGLSVSHFCSQADFTALYKRFAILVMILHEK